MTPNPESNEPKATAREPSGALREEIEEAFGSYAEFKDRFTKAALAKFGSGGINLEKYCHILFLKCN